MDGWSALFYATDQGHLDGMNCLLEHGADVSLISKVSVFTHVSIDNEDMTGSLTSRTSPFCSKERGREYSSDNEEYHFFRSHMHPTLQPTKF